MFPAKWIEGRGLGARIIALCVGLYLAAAALFTMIEALTVSGDVRKKTEIQIGRLGETNLPALTKAVWVYDQTTIVLILDGLVANPAVSRVELRGDNNVVRYGFDGVETPSGEAGASFVAESTAAPARLYPLIYRRKDAADVNLGSLVLYPSLREERERVAETVRSSLMRTALIVALLSGLLAITIERFLGSPLRDMARQLSAMDAENPGQASLVLPYDARGELVLVTDAFNTMIRRLEATIAALRESERRMRGFFENSPISIWEEDFSEIKRLVEEARARGVVDWAAFFEPPERVAAFATHMKVLDVNPASLTLLGCTEKAEILDSLATIFDEEDLGMLRPELIALASGLASFEGESVFRTREGRRVFVQFRLGVVPGYEESWARVIVSIVDLSERRKAEMALKESEARYRSIVEQSTEGIILIDGSGRIVDCNSALESMTGFGPESHLGSDIWDWEFRMLPETARTEEGYRLIKARWETVIDGGAREKMESFESIFRRTGGTLRIIEQTPFPISVKEGKMTGCILRDVTEQRETARVIMESLREKELLLQEIHHRVKNNLQVIISLLHLQEKNIPDPETRRMFSESQNRVHTMALIHERLYQSNDFEKIDFASYITSLARDLRDSYRVSEREVELRVDAEEIYLTIDRAITCGLIVNELLTNSFKYAFPNELRPEAPEVRIDLHRAHEGTVELVVSDNGVGLPAGMDPTQCESLGLSLVYMLANQLGGSAVYSRGARTRFTVSFKLD